MLKRHPIIAVLMLAIVLGFTTWAVIHVYRNIFYNPVKRLKISDVPESALQINHQQFSDFMPSGNIKAVSVPAEFKIEKLPWLPMISTDFLTQSSNEKAYQIAAETRSAFDPLKDDILREMLWELINLKNKQADILETEAINIHSKLSKQTGTELFEYKLYSSLASQTIESSMNQPNKYPLRQAETKSRFYLSRSDKAADNLSSYHDRFKTAMEYDLQDIRASQNEETRNKIMEIRDYLVRKTASINDYSGEEE